MADGEGGGEGVAGGGCVYYFYFVRAEAVHVAIAGDEHGAFGTELQDDFFGGVDVARGEFVVGAGGEDDGVLAFAIDEDGGGAGGDAFGDRDVPGVDIVVGKTGEEALAEVIIADAGDHVNLCAEFCGGD